MPIKQISVTEVKNKLDQKQGFRLIDVREPHEYEIAKIEGAELIPLSKFAQEAPSKLKQDEEIVIHCHHGGRSQRACEYLAGLGYTNLANVSGGINAWSQEIDPDVPQY